MTTHALVSDGPPGNRPATAAYLPSDARRRIAAVAPGLRLPAASPQVVRTVSGEVSVFSTGTVLVHWADGERSIFLTAAPEAAGGAAGELRRQVTACDGPPPGEQVAAGPEGAPGCYIEARTDPPTHSLYWRSGGNLYGVSDERAALTRDDLFRLASAALVPVTD
jgi:hypothetical protein